MSNISRYQNIYHRYFAAANIVCSDKCCWYLTKTCQQMLSYSNFGSYSNTMFFCAILIHLKVVFTYWLKKQTMCITSNFTSDCINIYDFIIKQRKKAYTYITCPLKDRADRRTRMQTPMVYDEFSNEYQQIVSHTYITFTRLWIKHSKTPM